MTYYDKLMLEYYWVLNNAWKTEIRDATRLAIQMLSDMPRAEKINKESIDKLMGIINTQLGDRSQHWSMAHQSDNRPLCAAWTQGDLIPEIYTSRRVTHESVTAVFSDQKFPALQQELDGRICCSEKT